MNTVTFVRSNAIEYTLSQFGTSSRVTTNKGGRNVKIWERMTEPRGGGESYLFSWLIDIINAFNKFGYNKFSREKRSMSINGSSK